MSDNVQDVRSWVRMRLRDTNPERIVINTLRLNFLLERQAILLSGRTHQPRSAILTVNLVAGTYDYALGSITAMSVGQVFLNATGRELVFSPFDTFNATYRQDTALPAGQGPPAEYTLWEATTNLTRIRVGPTPAESGALKIHTRALASVFDVSTPDTSVIPFARDLLVALELAVCAEAVEMASADDLAFLGLDRAIAATWKQESERAIRNYNQRALSSGMRQDRVLRSARMAV